MAESYAGKINRKLIKKRRVIAAAAGREKADLVLKNATYVNVFSNELCTADIAAQADTAAGQASEKEAHPAPAAPQEPAKRQRLSGEELDALRQAGFLLEG